MSDNAADRWDCTTDGVTKPCGECPACKNGLAASDAAASRVVETPPLLFATPSRRCPFRHFNGSKVWLTRTRGRRHVRRLRRYATTFLVYCPEENTHWWAIEDELFIIEP